MPRRTNPFQKLCHKVMMAFYTPEYNVKESVIEENPRTGTPREIDILITSNNDPNQKILIECRDHSRKQDVQWIDQIDGKARSLGFPKAIAISSSGFTKGAKTEGLDRNIDTLTLADAENFDWKNWIMSINEITIIIGKAELVDVSFGIDADWKGANPDISDKSLILLVEKRDNSRITFFDWISSFLNSEEVKNKLTLRYKPNSVARVKFPFPFAPEMGFIQIGIDEFIPLVELLITVDYYEIEEKVPLGHLSLEGKHVLTGETKVMGPELDLTMVEDNKIFTVLFTKQDHKI